MAIKPSLRFIRANSPPFERHLLEWLDGSHVEELRHELEIISLLGTGTVEGPPENAAECAQHSLTVLRFLVDTWITSGSGEPDKRNLKNRRAFQTFQTWVSSNPPTSIVQDDGELKLGDCRPRVYHYNPLYHSARDRAYALFFQLLTSNIKRSIFKCTHEECGKYFVLVKPRKYYKRGPVCPPHRRQQGTLRQRQQNRSHALQIASRAMESWAELSEKTRSKYRSDRHFVAGKLKRFGMGSKWVSRNLTQIEKLKRKNDDTKNA